MRLNYKNQHKESEKKKSFDEFLKLFKFPLIGGLLMLFELFVNTVDRVLPTELNQSGNFADGT